MKLLTDTNILIPAEPTSVGDLSPLTPLALRLQALAQDARVALCIHPEQKKDIVGDRNLSRRNLRLELIARYSELASPPAIQDALRQSIGTATVHSNDEVDDNLLAAVFGNAVNYLVTEDRAIHRKAARVGIAHRVLLLSDAVAVLEALFDPAPQPPPTVEAIPAYGLDESDPIFESFRLDYGTKFDPWLATCKLEGRQSWVVHEGSRYAALMIVKREDSLPTGVVGKVLKVCSFKVADDHFGRRYGELLLKTLFEHCRTNGFEHAYVTVYEKHEQLVRLMTMFGFELAGVRSALNESILIKTLVPPRDTEARGLEFNVRYGPHNVDFSQPALVIPIQPAYYQLLFPEQNDQPELGIQPHPYGNALRKAYLCNSRVKSLGVGSTIWFYRSKVDQGVVALGVLEEWVRSDSADYIAQYVGRRTVYSYDEIQELARKEILALLFRQARLLDRPIRLSELTSGNVLRAAPQSIVHLKPSEAAWLAKQAT